jgi:hypothetical protein
VGLVVVIVMSDVIGMGSGTEMGFEMVVVVVVGLGV